MHEIQPGFCKIGKRVQEGSPIAFLAIFLGLVIWVLFAGFLVFSMEGILSGIMQKAAYGHSQFHRQAYLHRESDRYGQLPMRLQNKPSD